MLGVPDACAAFALWFWAAVDREQQCRARHRWTLVSRNCQQQAACSTAAAWQAAPTPACTAQPPSAAVTVLRPRWQQRRGRESAAPLLLQCLGRTWQCIGPQGCCCRSTSTTCHRPSPSKLLFWRKAHTLLPLVATDAMVHACAQASGVPTSSSASTQLPCT